MTITDRQLLVSRKALPSYSPNTLWSPETHKREQPVQTLRVVYPQLNKPRLPVSKHPFCPLATMGIATHPIPPVEDTLAELMEAMES